MSSELAADLTAVDACLEEELGDRLGLIPAAAGQLDQLTEEVLDCATGGKRMRSRLALMAAGTRSNSGVMVAASVELLHAAFVLHDDVIDRDELRRGRPTLHHASTAAYSRDGWPCETATHRGYARSIIAGDLALSTAYALIHRAAAALAGEPGSRLLRHFDTAVTATTAGELLDIELSLPPTTGSSSPGEATSPATAVEVAALKTAWYSVALPLAAGGITAGLPERRTDALHRIGVALGTAFQLQDDVLGTFGSQEDTGKSTWGDLREGKPTYMLTLALASDRGQQIRELLARLGALEDESRALSVVAELRTVIRDSGATEQTRRRIGALSEQTSRLIDEADLPAPLARSLRTLTAELMDRES